MVFIISKQLHFISYNKLIYFHFFPRKSRMAPNQNKQILDFQPIMDQQTSLSSQKTKNLINTGYLQLYDFKMESVSDRSNRCRAKSCRGYLLICLLLMSLTIVYILVGHSAAWAEQIKSRSEAFTVTGRVSAEGQLLSVQSDRKQSSKLAIQMEKRRNPEIEKVDKSPQALLSSIKNSEDHFDEQLIYASEASNQESQPSLPPNLPKNQQIQINIIPSEQFKQAQPQNQLIYEVVKVGQSFIEYREKPKALIPSDQYIPIKVQPTIHPFNHQTQSSNNGIDLIGTEAGISTQMLYQARQRRKIVDYQLNKADSLTQKQIEYYQTKYNVGKYQELPFCIVVPTFNNAVADRYKKNIHSIIMQNYTNFHIVIIDDASSDSTGILIKNHLLLSNFNPERYLIKTNKNQQNAMPNLKSAALQNCKDDQIFLVVDGDDYLLGRQVLKVFNAVFQEKGLWFVYSNFLMGSGELGYSRPFPKEVIRENAYRSSAFVSSHLRAFYTKLFKNIEEKDLRNDYGNYFRAANDVAICFPVLEQAHLKVGYLPEMTYFYNADTGINNHFIRLDEQKANEMSVRNRNKYAALQRLF